MAVGQIGSNRAATSFNGITWTPRTAANTTNIWRSVTYGKVNDLSANNTTYLGKSIFVAVSSTGTNRVMTSIDGINWMSRNAYADTSNSWMNVKYGLVNGVGTFVAVSYNGANQVMTSTDGITWTGIYSYGESLVNWHSLAYGSGLFVAVGITNVVGINRTIYSSDGGKTWTVIATPVDNYSGEGFTSVAYGLVNGVGTFVAISYGNTSSNIKIITLNMNNVQWINSPISNTSPRWMSVTYGSFLINGQTNNGLFVVVAGSNNGSDTTIVGSNHVMVSTDGINWTSRNAYADTSNNWGCVGYGVVNGVGRFVSLAYNTISGASTVMTSDVIFPTISNIESNNTFVGYNTSIQYSTQSDLTTWNKTVSPYLNIAGSWYGVAYGLVNGVDTFVGVLRYGSKRIVYSNDAVNWRLIDISGINGIDGTGQYRNITYGNGRFVAVAESGNTRVITSVDITDCP